MIDLVAYRLIGVLGRNVHVVLRDSSPMRNLIAALKSMWRNYAGCWLQLSAMSTILCVDRLSSQVPDVMSDPINLSRAVMQALRGWESAGVTHLPVPADVPLPQVVEQIDETPDQVLAQGAVESDKAPAPESVVETQSAPQQLAALAARVAACTKCQELASTRTQTVFGVGNPEATVMFVGEAPGADEDAQGEPFVGKAGQLLDKIIQACGWKREEIYICNILRCRPPGNRNPTDEEAENCREFLDGQISAVKPEYVVCWGSVAARNLLNSPDSIGKMRGRFFNYGDAKVLCTYHPSYLLRTPSAKKMVWEDMKFLLREMGLEPPQ